jgi:D-alanyl-D-alanine carboxypeptidase
MGVLSHQLIDEGVFSLDDPISQWLDADMVSKLPNASCATVGQLLNHSACIYDLTSNQAYTLAILNNPNTPRSAEELLEFAYNQAAPCQCGERADYSNTHTLLLSLVMEAATGQPHGELLQRYIIEPLGLNNTVYYDHSYTLPPTTTHGYLDLNNRGRGLTDVTDWNTGSGYGYTGVYSNVFDLHTFVKALFEDNILLTESSRNRMFSDFLEVEDGSWATCYGAGMNFLEKGQDSTALGHGGADLGYSAGAYYFSNQQTYLCFTINYGRNLETDLGDIVGDFIDDISDAAIDR